LYLAKPLVKLNIKECLSLDLLNFVSIDDFPFYMRWGKFWKGAIQGPFHQSLVAIGPVVSEEKIKM
jgi:hypothetical protein